MSIAQTCPPIKQQAGTHQSLLSAVRSVALVFT
jgi:hypothetical protein